MEERLHVVRCSYEYWLSEPRSQGKQEKETKRDRGRSCVGPITAAIIAMDYESLCHTLLLRLDMLMSSGICFTRS